MLKLLSGLIAVSVASLNATAYAQSRAACVKSCEQKCARAVTTGRCAQACMNRNGCF